MVEDLEALGDPNCVLCLVVVELAGDVDSARWLCPECGLVQI
jgi:predicted RNA-binding Zn-ribbon protein involved in translation (DUF1610 family)